MMDKKKKVHRENLISQKSIENYHQQALRINHNLNNYHILHHLIFIKWPIKLHSSNLKDQKKIMIIL